MNTERVIKVAYYGDPIGRMSNDRLSIEFSPKELSSLKIHFTEQALKAKSYGEQTEMRELRETFISAYDMWDDYKRTTHD